MLFASARRGDATAHVVREVMPDAVAAYAGGLGATLDSAERILGPDLGPDPAPSARPAQKR